MALLFYSLCTFPHRKRSPNGLSIGVKPCFLAHTSPARYGKWKLRGRCDRGCYLTCAHPGGEKKRTHLRQFFAKKTPLHRCVFFAARFARGKNSYNTSQKDHQGEVTGNIRVPAVSHWWIFLTAGALPISQPSHRYTIVHTHKVAEGSTKAPTQKEYVLRH